MVFKNACSCVLALVLMLAAITADAVAGARGKGWNLGRRHTHIAHVRHTFVQRPGYAAVLPAGRVEWSEAPHLVRVGPNGYWLTSNWGCWIEEAQDRIADCDSANR